MLSSSYELTDGQALGLLAQHVDLADHFVARDERVNRKELAVVEVDVGAAYPCGRGTANGPHRRPAWGR